MIKKLIFLNVLMISILMLSGCASPIKVQLPAVEVSGGGSSDPITINPVDSVTIDPVAPVAAPAAAPTQEFFGNNMLMYLVVGLVIVIAVIALVAVASKNNSNNSSSNL